MYLCKRKGKSNSRGGGDSVGMKRLDLEAKDKNENQLSSGTEQVKLDRHYKYHFISFHT